VAPFCSQWRDFFAPPCIMHVKVVWVVISLDHEDGEE